MQELESKAYENFWTAAEIDKKREVVRNEFHYVFCPYSFPIIEEIEDAMDDLKSTTRLSSRFCSLNSRL